MSLFRELGSRFGADARTRSRRHCASLSGTFQSALTSRTSIEGCILLKGIAKQAAIQSA